MVKLYEALDHGRYVIHQYFSLRLLSILDNCSTYYFPFRNIDWIWPQRGRHWSKDGSVSMVNDKGLVPFEQLELDGHMSIVCPLS